jgi:hypothetical protein
MMATIHNRLVATTDGIALMVNPLRLFSWGIASARSAHGEAGANLPMLPVPKAPRDPPRLAGSFLMYRDKPKSLLSSRTEISPDKRHRIQRRNNSGVTPHLHWDLLFSTLQGRAQDRDRDRDCTHPEHIEQHRYQLTGTFQASRYFGYC